MVNDFDNVVQNAMPIERHSDRLQNGALNNVRVLTSDFWNGKQVVPVEIEIKEFKENQGAEPKLYMAVTINKEGETAVESSTQGAPLSVGSPSKISLTDLIKGVNRNNMNSLKYFPDSMLTPEQVEFKKLALEKEKVKYERKKRAMEIQLIAPQSVSRPHL